MPIQIASDEEFQEIWSMSNYVSEVADKLGYTTGSARKKATDLRKRGYALKFMASARVTHCPVCDGTECCGSVLAEEFKQKAKERVHKWRATKKEG